MKVFFNASLTGRKDYEDNYRAIDEIIRKSGHKLIASPTFTAHSNDVRSETIDQAEEYFKKLERWIKQSEINVFEVSYPSLGIGTEVAMSLQYNKPTIALHVKGINPYILQGNSNDKLQLLEYTLEDLEDTLSYALDYASHIQDVRFNFFVSPKITAYLDWIAKHKRIPRSVYLRDLIERDMDKLDAQLRAQEEL